MCNQTKATLDKVEHKNSFYKNKLDTCKGNVKKTYSIVNDLLDRHYSKSILPEFSNSSDMANDFKSFSLKKYMIFTLKSYLSMKTILQ